MVLGRRESVTYRVEWLGIETEYSSYILGLTHKRARWLVTWLREKSWAGNVTAKAQGLGRLGFAAISLDWKRRFLGAICLVVSHPRPSGSHDDTHHAEGFV